MEKVVDIVVEVVEAVVESLLLLLRYSALGGTTRRVGLMGA